jgi:hypothetical protein
LETRTRVFNHSKPELGVLSCSTAVTEQRVASRPTSPHAITYRLAHLDSKEKTALFVQEAGGPRLADGCFWYAGVGTFFILDSVCLFVGSVVCNLRINVNLDFNVKSPSSRRTRTLTFDEGTKIVRLVIGLMHLAVRFSCYSQRIELHNLRLQ